MFARAPSAPAVESTRRIILPIRLSAIHRPDFNNDAQGKPYSLPDSSSSNTSTELTRTRLRESGPLRRLRLNGRILHVVFWRQKVDAGHRVNPRQMIVDMLDTRDILRRNDDRLTNVLVSYDTTQIDDPISYNRIYPDWCPMMILDGCKYPAAKTGITRRRIRQTAQQTRDGLYEILPADHANDLSIPYDRHALDVIPLHEPNDVGERSVFSCSVKISCHDLANLPACGLHIILGHAVRTQDEFKPARPFPLGLKFLPAKKIPFGHNADKLALCINDRQTAEVIGKHKAGRVGKCRIRADCDDVVGHDVMGPHSLLLKFAAKIGLFKRLFFPKTMPLIQIKTAYGLQPHHARKEKPHGHS